MLFRSLAGEEQSELGPELLVAHAVDEGAEEARQDVDQNEGGEEDYGALVGQDPDEGYDYEGRHVGEHADEQLDAVQQDGVPRLPGRRSAAGGGGGGGVGGEQHLEVGGDQGDAHHGQEEDLGGEHNLSFSLHSMVLKTL